MEFIAKLLASYYLTPYTPKPPPKIRHVFGLSSAIRKAFLVKELYKRPKLKIECNVYKLCLLAACQCIGRESDEDIRKNPNQLINVVNKDIYLFKKIALESEIFESSEEINAYAVYLHWPLYDAYSSLTIEERIIKTAYLLDMRRLSSKSQELFQNIMETSLLSYNEVNVLWLLSQKYLENTGDKDLILKRKKYSDVFYTLSVNYVDLLSVLQIASPRD